MNYFAHQMPKYKIRKIVDELLSVCDDMGHLENNMLDFEFNLGDKYASQKTKNICQEQLANCGKLKVDIEQVFQAKLSVLSDFDYLARTYTSELLEAISEVNPDAVEEEAVNNSKTGRR